LVLNDPFEAQNGLFNEMATWRVQIGITFPDMSGIIKGKRVKGKGNKADKLVG